jgi:hypothetical protein
MHKVHTRTYHRARLLGTCTNHNHEGEHLEGRGCIGFKVTDKLPSNLGRMVIEPDRRAIANDLIAHNGPRPWAELVSSVTAVIR